jgi:hypothetical protein
VDANNESFPAPGGDGHSLDCFPTSGKNVSGVGLQIDLVQTTGARSMSAGIPCGLGVPFPHICPCATCSNERTRPCRANADCSSGGLCNKAGPFVKSPSANECGSGAVCTDSGNGIDGVCVGGSPTTYCDGSSRANGEPFVTCLNNADCDNTDCGFGIGVGLCGECTIEKARPCFLDPIVAAGEADPARPIGAALFCIPPTANSGINDVAGLPGPGRVVNQAQSTLFCASDPDVQYVPGVGGCPE